MKLIILIYIIVLACITGVSCQQHNDKKGMEMFEAESNQAKKLFLQKDFQNAELHYNLALEIAKKPNWTDGIVMTKSEISKIYAAKKQYKESETILVEAKDICKNKKDCSSGQLASIYNNLIFTYLFWMKDISKATEIVNEVIASQQRLSEDEDVSNLLNGYVRNMRTAGFEKEAAELENRIKSIE
jgi:tetratricopeptide (TPR) repeat protein